MKEFRPVDFNTEFWEKLKAYYELRLQEYRIRNDGKLDHEKTVHLRGRIAEALDVLALPETTAPAPADDE